MPDHGPDLQHDIALLEQALEMAAPLSPAEHAILRPDLTQIADILAALKLRLALTRPKTSHGHLLLC